jgi:nucleotide-binding universal stress UspA family protein
MLYWETADQDPPLDFSTSEFAAGHPAGVLREKGRGARMVVLGEPGRRAVTRLLHTSVAHAVTKDPPCRVVIVAAEGSLVSESAWPSAST